MVVDPLATRGIAVEPPTPQTLARIKDATGVEVTPARIIDLTLAGAQYKVMKGALDVLTTAPEFDLVVVVVGSSARFYPDLAVKPIIDSAGAAKPIAAFLVPEAPDALARLAAAGRAEFPHAGGLRRRRRGRAAAARAAADRGAARPSGRRGPHARRTRSLCAARSASACRTRRRSRSMPSIKQAPALPFAYPVAVKALSAKIAHKSDVGGVRVECARRSRAARGHRQNPAGHQCRSRAGAADDCRASARCLIGYRVDADVGPLVMLAAGGILAEIHRDRSLRLAPVDLAEAKAMIGEVAALKALAGYRGKPPGDLDALAQALVALSQLAVARRPRRRRGRGQSADRQAERRRRRRRRCAGEARVGGQSHDRTNSRPGERRRQPGPARALSQHDVPAGDRRPGLSRQDHRGPHRFGHAGAVRHAELQLRAARAARRMGDVLEEGAGARPQRHFRAVQARQAHDRRRPASVHGEPALHQGRAGRAAQEARRAKRRRPRDGTSPRFEPITGRYLNLDSARPPAPALHRGGRPGHSAAVPAHRRLRRPAVSRPAQRQAHHRQLSRHRVRHAVARQVVAARGLSERGIQADLARLHPDDPGDRRRAANSTSRW